MFQSCLCCLWTVWAFSPLRDSFLPVFCSVEWVRSTYSPHWVITRIAEKVLALWNQNVDPWPLQSIFWVGEVGLSSKSLCDLHCSSFFDAFFFFVSGNISSGFGKLMPISVSFLVCSGSDPHFNPYLAVTKINWLGSLSKCRICICFASSLKFPPYPLFHYIPIYQPIKTSY